MTFVPCRPGSKWRRRASSTMRPLYRRPIARMKSDFTSILPMKRGHIICTSWMQSSTYPTLWDGTTFTRNQWWTEGNLDFGRKKKFRTVDQHHLERMAMKTVRIEDVDVFENLHVVEIRKSMTQTTR